MCLFKPKTNGHGYIDLKLPSKTLWAAFNVGANSETEFGDHFAWGETEPKKDYSWNTYKFGGMETFTKYNGEDGKTVLDLEDDAARVHMGGKWHMPTAEDYKELVENTTSAYTEISGVTCTVLTSKRNGRKIVFPACGFYEDDHLWYSGQYIDLWTSSLDTFGPTYSYGAYGDEYTFDTWANYYYPGRCNGHCVRGVIKR